MFILSLSASCALTRCESSHARFYSYSENFWYAKQFQFYAVKLQLRKQENFNLEKKYASLERLLFLDFRGFRFSEVGSSFSGIFVFPWSGLHFSGVYGLRSLTLVFVFPVFIFPTPNRFHLFAFHIMHCILFIKSKLFL